MNVARTSGVFIGLLGVAMLVVACGHTASQGHALKFVLRQVSCPEDQVVLQERARGLYDATACGARLVIRCSSELCANLNAEARARFESEHDCPATDASASEISHLIFKVDGCGKSANYACDMRSSIARCVAESSVTR
jgi:hypothetical protein